MNTQTVSRLATALLIAAAVNVAVAQTDKSVVIEQAPAFPTFTQWVSTYVIVMPEAPLPAIRTLPLTPVSAAADATYQPWPVILGLPELPLVGPGAMQAAKSWGGALNYQGVFMRQVVLDAGGARRDVRAMGAPLKAGDRFKIRITATYDALAEVDQVVGDAWFGKRTGQVYPQPGLSVQMKAGESVELPMASNEYFVMSKAANERLVVSVHHAKALGEERTSQPVYRQDGKGGSSYLQLVPRGTYPALEQQVAQER